MSKSEADRQKVAIITGSSSGIGYATSLNHIKHNLEYGYQLMNLIERPRRRQRTVH